MVRLRFLNLFFSLSVVVGCMHAQAAPDSNGKKSHASYQWQDFEEAGRKLVVYDILAMSLMMRSQQLNGANKITRDGETVLHTKVNDHTDCFYRQASGLAKFNFTRVTYWCEIDLPQSPTNPSGI